MADRFLELRPDFEGVAALLAADFLRLTSATYRVYLIPQVGVSYVL